MGFLIRAAELFTGISAETKQVAVFPRSCRRGVKIRFCGRVCVSLSCWKGNTNHPIFRSSSAHSHSTTCEHVSHLPPPSARPPPNRAGGRRPFHAPPSRRTAARTRRAPRTIPTQWEDHVGFRTVSISSSPHTAHACPLMPQLSKINILDIKIKMLKY